MIMPALIHIYNICDARNTTQEDHAFVIGSVPGGISERLARFKVDEHTTFKKLRRLIEVQIKHDIGEIED